MSFSTLTPERPLLLLGAGNMGRAMLTGWLASGLDPAACQIVDTKAHIDGIMCHTAIPADIRPRVIVLSVKPQIIDDLFDQINNVLSADTLVISIIAGKTIGHFQSALGGHENIIRAMPNLPATIGQGATALCCNGAVSPAERAFATQLMAATGTVVWVEKESQINAVTALSGSGPAYVFHLMECMISAGVQLGLTEDAARILAIETVAGAGALARQSGTDVATLRQQVTSPGGTTEAGLDVLMGKDGLAGLIRHTLEAAAKRAKELGG
jgi:pyrroline-5-carboxylate reductase